jgi:hypothetical protein
MNISDINLKNARIILDWCYQNLGRSKYRPYSKLKISMSRSINCKGMYEEEGDSSTIYINPKRHRSFNEFIDTMIHEYIHFLQSLRYYDQIMEITGYDKHPMEHSSNLVADILKHRCRKELFSR